MPRPPALFLPAIALCHALCQARPAPSPLLQMRSLRQRGKRCAPPASRRGGARSRSRFASPRPALRHSHAAHRCVGGCVFVTRWHASPACCPGGGSHTFQPRESGCFSTLFSSTSINNKKLFANLLMKNGILGSFHFSLSNEKASFKLSTDSLRSWTIKWN